MTSETSSPNASTRVSTVISETRGSNPSGAAASSRLTPQRAASMPSAPPSSARIAPSTSVCRASRHRLAPKTARTLVSRCRADARANSKLAMFTAAISSTSPDAPQSTSNAGRIVCDISSAIGTKFTPVRL